MAWMEKRKTTHPEDKAYSLFDIFGVCIPILYGEGGENPLKQLQDEVAKADVFVAPLRLTAPRDDKERIADINCGLFRGAPNWILDHDDLRRWRVVDDAQLLCVQGDPTRHFTADI
jgi:hypothetical protein